MKLLYKPYAPVDTWMNRIKSAKVNKLDKNLRRVKYLIIAYEFIKDINNLLLCV